VAPPSIEIAVEQGRLSVDVRDAPLDEVLLAVGEEAGIAIEIRGDLTAHVTHSFADLPLDEGIRRLLRGHSYTLSGDAERSRRIEISILTSYRTEAVAAAGNASTPGDDQDRLQRIRALAGRKDAEAIAELSRLAGGDPNPVVRGQAIAALGRLKTQEASLPLTLALSDPSAAVRMQALRGVKSLKGAAAFADLQAIAGYDPDAAVRRQAVRLVSDIRNPEVPWLLEQAAADSDAAVSQEAKRAARRWEQRYGAKSGAAGGTR
jgi:HEAT repeat protein